MDRSLCKLRLQQVQMIIQDVGQFMTQGRLFPLIIRSGVQDDHIPVRSPLRESVHPKGKWLFPDPDTLLSAKILESHTYHPS